MNPKIKETISLEFDAFSKDYTSDMITVVPHYLSLMSCFNDCLPLKFEPRSILDLGCGNGNSTAEIIHRFLDAEYTLVDASAEMLAICKARFSDSNIKLVESYFSDFEFSAASYDLIIAGFSMHHCEAEEKKSLFKKLKTSLMPNGYLAMSDLFITKTDDTHPALLEYWKNYINGNDPSGEKWAWLKEHYDRFDSPHNFESQKTWLSDAGFSNIEIAWNEGVWMHVMAS